MPSAQLRDSFPFSLSPEEILEKLEPYDGATLCVGIGYHPDTQQFDLLINDRAFKFKSDLKAKEPLIITKDEYKALIASFPEPTPMIAQLQRQATPALEAAEVTIAEIMPTPEEKAIVPKKTLAFELCPP